MADTEKKNEDLKFNREELSSDDLLVAQTAREKRNSPLPEAFREDPSSFPSDWPVHEGRKPAAMRADDAASLEYKVATLEEVPEAKRQLEATEGTGEVARQNFAALVQKNATEGLNEVQAPPTTAAQTAADGGGAASAPIPIVEDGKVTNPPKTAQRSDSKK